MPLESPVANHLFVVRCYKLASYKPAHLFHSTAERGHSLTNAILASADRDGGPKAKAPEGYRPGRGDGWIKQVGVLAMI